MSALENWLSVVGYEGLYEVSDHGRVRSLDRLVPVAASRMNPTGGVRRAKGRILRPGMSSNGYLTAVIGGQSMLVQHLVAAAFIGPRPDGHLVLHGDGVRSNNAVGNLRYGTRVDNAEDMVSHGTRIIGAQHAAAKFCDFTAGVVRALKGHFPQSDLAMLFTASPAAIQAIHDGRTWRHADLVSKETATDWLFSFGPAAIDRSTPA